MNRYVLDNSVSMRWLLSTQKQIDQEYAEKVLLSLAEAVAVVPQLWHLEASNVLMSAERRGDLEIGEVERFTAQLECLPIQLDPLTSHQAFSHILTLSRAYNLSTYDAAYLELAIRENLPLATLDKDLKKAAKKAGVPIYMNIEIDD
jgi:predicted nucleic acid-binding protein